MGLIVKKSSNIIKIMMNRAHKYSDIEKLLRFMVSIFVGKKTFIASSVSESSITLPESIM